MASREDALLAERFFTSLPEDQKQKIVQSVGGDSARREEMAVRLAGLARKRGIGQETEAAPVKPEQQPGSVRDILIPPAERFSEFRRDIGQDVGQTALGALEGYTAGLPRMALEKAFPELDIPRGNLLGQIGGFSYGPGKLIRGLGEAVKIGGPVLRPTLQGLTEGVVAGAAFPQEGLDPGNRAFNAAIGGGLGVLLGAGSGALKAFKESKQAREALRRIEDEELMFKSSQRSKLPQELAEEQKFLRQRKGELLKQEKESFQAQLSDLDSKLKLTAEKGAQAAKQPIIDTLNSTRRELGQTFDDVLINSPEAGLTVGELRKITGEIADELARSGVESTDEAISGLSKLVGERTDNTIISNLELHRLKAQINAGNMGRVQSGSVSPSDLAEISFASKITNYLKQNVPGFERVSGEYKQLSDLSKFAYKRFAPRSSEFEVGRGATTLVKAAKGKLTDGERKAISLLEEKTGINFTKGVKNTQEKINELTRLGERRLREIESQLAVRIRELDSKIKLARQSNEARANSLAAERLALQRTIEDLHSIVVTASRIAFSGGTIVAGGLLIDRLRRQ